MFENRLAEAEARGGVGGVEGVHGKGNGRAVLTHGLGGAVRSLSDWGNLGRWKFNTVHQLNSDKICVVR